jgi:hypothetical protein
MQDVAAGANGTRATLPFRMLLTVILMYAVQQCLHQQYEDQEFHDRLMNEGNKCRGCGPVVQQNLGCVRLVCIGCGEAFRLRRPSR